MKNTFELSINFKDGWVQFETIEDKVELSYVSSVNRPLILEKEELKSLILAAIFVEQNMQVKNG